MASQSSLKRPVKQIEDENDLAFLKEPSSLGPAKKARHSLESDASRRNVYQESRHGSGKKESGSSFLDDDENDLAFLKASSSLGPAKKARHSLESDASRRNVYQGSRHGSDKMGFGLETAQAYDKPKTEDSPDKLEETRKKFMELKRKYLNNVKVRDGKLNEIASEVKALRAQADGLSIAIRQKNLQQTKLDIMDKLLSENEAAHAMLELDLAYTFAASIDGLEDKAKEAGERKA